MEDVQAICTSAEVRDEYLSDPATLVISNDGDRIVWKTMGETYVAPSPTPEEILRRFTRLQANPAINHQPSLLGEVIFFFLIMGTMYVVGMGWMILIARLPR